MGVSDESAIPGLMMYRTAVPRKKIKQIPTKILAEQDQYRWTRDTRAGTVVLRKLRYLDGQAIGYVLSESSPEYRALRDRAAEYIELEHHGVTFSPQQEKDLEEIGRQLSVFQKPFHMACYVQAREGAGGEYLLPKDEVPQFETVEEYDAYLGAIGLDDASILQHATMILTNLTDAVMSAGDLLLMQELGLPLRKDLSMETMTVDQASAMGNAIEAKYDAIERAQ